MSAPVRLSWATTPGIMAAFRALRETAQDCDHEMSAWIAAVAVARDIERGEIADGMEAAGARAFCLALLRGDVARAATLSAWIHAPGVAADEFFGRLDAAKAVQS